MRGVWGGGGYVRGVGGLLARQLNTKPVLFEGERENKRDVGTDWWEGGG